MQAGVQAAHWGHAVSRSAPWNQHQASLQPGASRTPTLVSAETRVGVACIESPSPPRRGSSKQVIFSNHRGWKESPPAHGEAAAAGDRMGLLGATVSIHPSIRIPAPHILGA